MWCSVVKLSSFLTLEIRSWEKHSWLCGLHPVEMPALTIGKGPAAGPASLNATTDEDSCITWCNLNQHLQHWETYTKTAGLDQFWTQRSVDSRYFESVRNCKKLYEKETSVGWSSTGILFLSALFKCILLKYRLFSKPNFVHTLPFEFQTHFLKVYFLKTQNPDYIPLK